METLALSDAMMNEFKKGCLAPLREVVCTDDTLVMRFWGRKVEVDYRGQVLINVWQIGTKYSIYTMPFFNRYIDPAEGDNMDRVLNLIPHYKNVTDDLLWEDPEMEGERRQLVERLNNRSGRVSRSSDYNIVGVSYMGIKPHEHKNAPIDIMALKDFRHTEDGNTIASLSLMQVCPDRPKPLPESDAYRTTDLDTQLKLLFERTKLIDKMEQTLKCVKNEDWLQDARENLRTVFLQKCELGLIDSQGIEGEFDIDVTDPQIALLAFDQSPKVVGTRSLLQTIATLDPDDRIQLVSGAPMGLAIYEDYVRPLAQYLEEVPVPKSRLHTVRGLEAEDFERLEFAQSILENIQNAATDGEAHNWEDIRRAVLRVYGFLLASSHHENRIVAALRTQTEEGELAQLAEASENLKHAAAAAKGAMPEAERAAEAADGPSADVREHLGAALKEAVDYIGAAIAIYDVINPQSEEEIDVLE